MNTPNPLIAAYQANQNAQAPALGTSIGVALPSAAPSIGPALGSPLVTQAPPTQTQTDQTERNRLINTGSGVDQISNPLLRGIAKTADIVGSVFAPNLAQFIPGTTLHHQLLMNQATNNVEKDQAEDEADTHQQDQQAQVTQRQALAEQEQAKAFALTHPKPVADVPQKPENLQQEYADAVTSTIGRGEDPAHDPKVQQLADAITSLQRQPAAKEANKDDKYIAINAKLSAGQPLSPDETAFKSGYEHYVKVNKIDPAGVRVQAMLSMPQAIVDPNDPSREIFTTRKGAVGQEAPGSGEAKAARGADTYFTTGKGGQFLASATTSQNHLQLLGQAAQALDNGDSTLLNSAAQGFAKATGSAAPTNFDAVKNAVNGEIAKALTGNVTVSEQAALEHDMNNASSPKQIAGIVQKYTQLIQGKKDALQQQYNSAKQGQANFGGTTQNAPAATHVFNPKTGKIEAIQ